MEPWWTLVSVGVGASLAWLPTLRTNKEQRATVVGGDRSS